MFEKLKDRLAKVLAKLNLDKQLLGRAQRRYLSQRKLAFISHNQQKRAQSLADKARAKGNTRKAGHYDKAALRFGHKANKAHSRAQYWLGKVKQYQQKINHLNASVADLNEELKKYNHVSITANQVTGGKPRDRLVACAHESSKQCAEGHRNNFYSQSGNWDVKHCITGELYGERSDCSSWVTSVYYSCGLGDPNGTRFSAGYTGTLMSHCRRVFSLKPGDLVIYGGYPGHHVEMYVGPGVATIGHGSAPVDAGVIDLFGDGNYGFYRQLDD